MIEHAEVLNVLLSHSRGLLDDGGVKANDGFQVYILELPGLDFIVEAKRTSNVGYTYIIKFYDRRFKIYTSRPHAPALLSIIPKSPALPKAAKELRPKPIPRTSAVMEAVSSKRRTRKT